MKTAVENDCLILYPIGRIDAGNSAAFSQELYEAMEKNPGLEPVVDMEEITYISSSGLRVLLKLGQNRSETLRVRNVSPEVYEIFRVTGFTSILDVSIRKRCVSVEGCEVIGRGAVGTVYKLDEDTIVKVYSMGEESLPMIENEQKRAKQALIRGIPTAISYDVVRVGENYGSVFEMVNARTFNELIRSEPDQAEELIGRYAELINQVHAVRMDPGELPDSREVYRGYLKSLASVLPEDLRQRIGELLDAMPEDLRVVHGDIQMKNVMLSGNEPMLIDMDTLSVGDPVFEFAGLFVTYRAYGEDEPNNSMDFLGIEEEMSERIFRRTLELCLGEPGEEKVQEAENKVRLLGYIRFLYLLTALGIGSDDLCSVRIRHSLKHLNDLVCRVSGLTL